MSEKVGRNDPCPCGSGKKFKNCCMTKAKVEEKPKGLRKFTAKIISGGGAVQQQRQFQEREQQAVVDYNTLMERSFGPAIHAPGDKPPLPADPSVYLVQDSDSKDSKE